MTERAARTTRQVLESHLGYRQQGELEQDLAENYDPDVVLLSAEGVHHGHDGVRFLAGVLKSYVPAGTYQYDDVLADGEIGMLQWRATEEDVQIHDGADSYLVRDGRIRAQTIHYSTRRR